VDHDPAAAPDLITRRGGSRSRCKVDLYYAAAEAQMYLDADLALKERALARTAPPHVGRQRFRPKDSLLAFLESL
jgi:hypothetical protein